MLQSSKPTSLYIHIPFCDHICSYCDFTKLFYNSKFSKQYIDALKVELESYNIGKQKTIYIGGGTPTSLSDEEFECVLSFFDKYVECDTEFTVEANVENLTENKLRIMIAHNVTRLSIGIQSSHNKRLKSLGRNHSFEDAIKAVKLAKKYDFDSINVDLIYGYPGETICELEEDLKNILALDVDHISIYSLIVSPGTIFYNLKVNEQNQDDSRAFYDVILKTLREHGYERYEISNFARNKKYSRHNLNYWRNKQYYGIGLGASGYVNNIRYINTKNLTKYCEFNFVDNKEVVDENSFLEYYLLTNFRLENGFSRKEFNQLFGVDFEEKFAGKFEKFKNKSQIIIDNDTIRLSDDGLMIMDHILLKLI